jgi:hypothetical protein
MLEGPRKKVEKVLDGFRARIASQTLPMRGLPLRARLEPLRGGCKPRGNGERPEFRSGRVQYDCAQRVRAMPYGGLGVMHDLAHEVGLVRALDEGVQVLKIHRPYSESDHILNLAYNALCGGRVLEDIELRRNDLAFLDALGARAIPDPTSTTSALSISVG